jgi:2-hydroxycyclohexanecarboxyl-CoA dehydrogenase
MELRGKAAIISAGGAGIGRSCAIKLASLGANVGVFDLVLEKAQETVKEIGNLKIDAQTVAYRADATKHSEVMETVRKFKEKFGRIDILVNGVGFTKSVRFLDTNEAYWDQYIAINYKSFLNFCYAVLPTMQAQNSGRIICIASDSGRVGNVGEIVYSGMKAAVVASSKVLAREFARYNINVNCVSPGPIRTAFLDDLMSTEKGRKTMEAVINAIPFRRAGEPEEVADAVVFFATDASKYVTGQNISIDGGLLMIG